MQLQPCAASAACGERRNIFEGLQQTPFLHFDWRHMDLAHVLPPALRAWCS